MQFFLLWGILFINVTAGIGILAQASPMMQDMFHRTPLEAAAIVSLISIFNASGRFLWASASDYIGRRNTYTIFFVAQLIIFLMIPGLASSGNWIGFEAALPPGGDRVHIYDAPLQVLAGLLAVGVLLTLLVRPLPMPHPGIDHSRT